MFKIIIQRLLVSLPTLLGVSILSFVLIRWIPGDPVLLMLGERGADPAVYAEMRANLGLDKNIVIQYFTYIGNALTGDLGTSIISKKSVLAEFTARFPATFELGFMGIMIAVIVGVPLGIFAALKRKSFLDYTLMGSALVGYSMPIFWWGLILILVFSVNLGWTPVSGRIGALFDVEPVTGFLLFDSLLSEDGIYAFWDALKHLILPSIALGTVPLAAIARMTRSSLLEVLKEDYIRTAKAKGLKQKTVVVKHALRNALVPIITIIGLMFGSILTGAILTETIFSWPGIGKWIVQSVTARDYPVIQGGVLLIALIIILVNLTVDLLYLWANPMLRESK
ncbi:MAG: ABC transporter permease [Bdellovibrionaceae bacterium]|jgi:dipeptide transport system permease protein|nr:ABC transporter permease [Pseudobdellovibrionaceae bacterium]